jgi:FkbM family methyltransferase
MIYDLAISSFTGARFSIRLELDADNSNESYALDFIKKGQYHEAEISLLMLRAIHPGDFVVDVGANVGVFTVLMAKLVGPNGLVLAVEPDAYNLKMLRNNIRINNLNNVRVIEKPLWSSVEPITFYPCVDSTGSGSVWDIKLWPGNEKTRDVGAAPVKMLSTTLDVEFNKVGRRCSFIKLDTEGVDECILRALGDCRPDYIVSELNVFGQSQFGNTNETLRGFMRGLGYDCFLLYDDGRLPSLVPGNSEITNGDNGFVVCNVLFSTLEKVGKAWPQSTNIRV